MSASEGISEICADFLVEAREIVDQLGEQMVVLERAPEDRDALNTVFRGFHTIKGGAGFLDFPPMVTLCHAVEDRLDVARNGSLPLDGFAFDGAQQAIDLLADMLDCVAHGRELYSQTCVACHGSDGTGGVHGAPLKSTTLSLEEIVSTIAAGRNEMPGFGRTYQPEDLHDVAAYIVEELREQ